MSRNNNYNIKISAKDEASKRLQTLSRNVQAVNKNISKTGKLTRSTGMKTFSAGFKQASGAVTGLKRNFSNFYKIHQTQISSMSKSVTLWAGGLTSALAYGVAKFATAGATFKQTSEAFKNLSSNYGIQSEELLSALKRTSAGTISAQNLMLASNKSFSLGVAKSTEEMTTLMEIARVKARNMGITTSQAFDDIVTGLGRGSPMILDNLGIIVKLSEAQEQYAKVLGKTVQEMSSAELKQALINRVVSDGKKELEQLGEIYESDADKIERFKANLQDTADTIGVALLPVVVSVSESLSAFSQKVKNFVELHPTLISGVTKFALGLGGLVTALGAGTFAITKLVSAYGVLKVVMSAGIFTPIISALVALKAGVIAMATANIVLSGSFFTLSGATAMLGTAFTALKAGAIALYTTLAPLVMIIGAIAGVIAGGLYIYNSWNSAQDKSIESGQKLAQVQKKSQEEYKGLVRLQNELTMSQNSAVASTENYAKTIANLNKQMADVRKGFNQKAVDNKKSMAEKFIEQEDKIKSTEEEITTKKAEIKKAIEEKNSKDISDVRKKTLLENIANLNSELIAKQESLSREAEALANHKDLAISLQGEITEARRVASLTEFERAVEGFNQKKKLMAQELSEKIKNLVIARNEATKNYRQEQATFKKFQEDKRKEINKTLKTTLKALILEAKAKGEDRARKRAEKAVAELSTRTRSRDVVKGGLGDLQEWIYGRRDGRYDTNEQTIYAQEKAKQDQAYNKIFNNQITINGAQDDQKIIDELMRYLEEAK